jgi:cobalamin transport system ATP-binding protein
MSDPAISVHDLTCGYGGTPVLQDVTIDVPHGDFLGILGPNGSGKTTLLRAITGMLKPKRGTVRIGEDDVASLGPREVARRVACVMQDAMVMLGSGHMAFTVRDVVTMGRAPYLARTGWETRQDHEAVDRAMADAEVAELADRPVTELSGGERQRAFIAMALAQECDIVLLDEPTNHLDVAHQLGILDLFSQLNRDGGKTLVGVFHDLNLAAEYCHRIALLKDGRIAAVGVPDETITTENVRTIYGADVDVSANPATGRPHVFLRGRDGATSRDSATSP